MTKEEFLSLFSFETEEEKKSCLYYLKIKGVTTHKFFYDKICSVKENNKDVTYKEVSSLYRYDKKIRNILFKYFNYIEEYIRGYFLDNYSLNDNVDNVYEKFDFIYKKIIKSKKYRKTIKLNIADKIGHMFFSELIFLYFIDINNVDNKNKLDKDLINQLKCIINMRNSVMHCKTIFDNNNLISSIVKYSKLFKNNLLYENIFNLCSFLTKESALNLLKDIGRASTDNNKDTNELKKMVLLDTFIINIDVLREKIIKDDINYILIN